MIENFFKDENDIKVIDWLLDHPSDSYAASIIGIDIHISPKELADTIHTLELYGIVEVSFDFEDVPTLRVKLNTENKMVKGLTCLNDALEDFVYGSDFEEQMKLLCNELKVKEKIGAYQDNDIDEMIHKLENWEECMPEPDNWAEFALHQKITKDLMDMKDNGSFEDFIEFVKNLKNQNIYI